MFANDTNRVRGAVLCLSQDGACTNLLENLGENNLKGDLSNDTTDNPSLFSLVNTFNLERVVVKIREAVSEEEILQLLFLYRRLLVML